MTGEETPQAARPILRVVSGNPTPEELAAIVTVVAVAASSAAETGEPAAAGQIRSRIGMGRTNCDASSANARPGTRRVGAARSTLISRATTRSISPSGVADYLQPIDAEFIKQFA